MRLATTVSMDQTFTAGRTYTTDVCRKTLQNLNWRDQPKSPRSPVNRKLHKITPPDYFSKLGYPAIDYDPKNERQSRTATYIVKTSPFSKLVLLLAVEYFHCDKIGGGVVSGVVYDVFWCLHASDQTNGGTVARKKRKLTRPFVAAVAVLLRAGHSRSTLAGILFCIGPFHVPFRVWPRHAEG